MTEVDRDRVTASWGAEAGGWSVLVHGGAGDVPHEKIARHVDGCRTAAQAAEEVLRGGGSALDAVEKAVLAMEDDPSFNAGTGACLNAEGLIELDAAIMEGSRLRAGAVCALPPFLHPVAIARAALEDGEHVLYAAEGAARFAEAHGFTRSTVEAMTTEVARARWEAVRNKTGHHGWAGGTVGAVARDANGVVAAATSTGGRIFKRAGRVGDSPVLGAGNYADDDGGACSMTGDGEAVMRLCLAKAAVDLLRARSHPEEAARAAIRQMATRLGGTGGIILVDRTGRLGFARNTRTMTWAAAGERLREVMAGA
ncbi:MAG TPA: isoaspartyl peptidase/L-asparaginase [Polyangiaceae bacterium]|jgi:beta-aspartyl-peptidase (threonine type)